MTNGFDNPLSGCGMARSDRFLPPFPPPKTGRIETLAQGNYT